MAKSKWLHWRLKSKEKSSKKEDESAEDEESRKSFDVVRNAATYDVDCMVTVKDKGVASNNHLDFFCPIDFNEPIASDIHISITTANYNVFMKWITACINPSLPNTTLYGLYVPQFCLISTCIWVFKLTVPVLLLCWHHKFINLISTSSNGQWLLSNWP